MPIGEEVESGRSGEEKLTLSGTWTPAPLAVQSAASRYSDCAMQTETELEFNFTNISKKGLTGTQSRRDLELPFETVFNIFTLHHDVRL
jgi:hypothetical protein